MATFELQGPDGGTYQVDAPDPQTAFAALHGGGAPQPQPAAVNPFNRQMGADVSYGAPLQAPIPTPDLDRAGEFRAAAGGPLMDRGAAALQTYLPAMLGGTGQDYGTNLAANRADTAAAQAAHPADAMSGNIAGAVPYAMLAPGGILGAAGAGAVSGAASSPDWSNLPQTGLSALEGGALGGGIGATAKGIGAGINAFRGAPVDASVPTLDTIEPMKTAAYKAADDLGAAYTPQAYSDLVSKIASDASDAKLNPKLNPRAAAAIEDMQTHADSALSSNTPITLTDLDQVRQFVNRNVTSNAESSERYFGNQIRNNIDEFIANAGPDQMAGEAGPDAAAAIQNARDLNTRYMKSQALVDALNKADNRASTTYSGGNLDNATRQQVRRLAEGRTAWTPDESAQLQTAMRGGPVQNALRYAGKVMAPSGLVGAGELGALVAGHPAALGFAGAGLGAKAASTALTEANTRNLMATILRGGTAAPSSQPMNLSPLANVLAAYGSARR